MSNRPAALTWQLPALLLMTILIAGCGGTYYTIEGSMEAKTLIVHEGKEEIKIDLATGMGGGLAGNAVDMEGNFVIEKDGVKVEGSVDPTRRVKVKNVTYKGQKVGLGSMGADI